MPVPLISVIIPVFNDSERLRLCLQALDHQTYPLESYEIIVIDNNSTENLGRIVALHKQAKLGFEATRGSYAARNKGISLAKGNILAFTDSDCIPQPNWIQSGVETLQSDLADMVGGNVIFTFSKNKSIAEVYDSRTNMQIRQNIENRKVSKTANLFTKKHVFDKVGLFPNHLKSGGDVIWTKMATENGFKLVYSEKAAVHHPARPLLPLLKKQYRVGKGQPFIWLEQGLDVNEIHQKIKSSFRPPSPREFWKASTSEEDVEGKFLQLWLVAWLSNTATNLGRLNTTLKGLK